MIGPVESFVCKRGTERRVWRVRAKGTTKMGNVVSQNQLATLRSVGISTGYWSAFYVAAYAALRVATPFNLHRHEDALLSSSRLASLIHSSLTTYKGDPSFVSACLRVCSELTARLACPSLLGPQACSAFGA